MKKCEAGCVVRGQEHDTTVDEDTRSYHENFGSYTDALSEHSLSTPHDSVCQWVMLCFNASELVVLRSS